MYQIIKRLFDVFSSLFALFVLSPLWLVAIIGIELSDFGPIFYMANRVGKDNKPFKMFKFRSMRIEKNASEKSFRADKNRIFKWGQIMRDTKLDELPQLVNVLKGDMSVIGPRPASIDQMEVTRGGRYKATASLKPGLSGPSAIYDYIYGDQFDDEDEYEEKVLPTRLDLDLYYLDAKSVKYDIKMICYTIVCILNLLLRNNSEFILRELESCAKTVRE